MRLDLPAQTKAVDRRDPQESPLLPVKKRVIDGTVTVIKVKSDRGYGPEPGDPPAALNLNSRGWHCRSGSACTWMGRI
ncbi:hypothetical protein OHB00_00010 [Streptomyces sp. NBC_00631]|uniref:hypothetical protein n=1 Tax=Streptomyces sp. NBC_00631 TaxID=2975793 RepID=UPI0030E55F62